MWQYFEADIFPSLLLKKIDTWTCPNYAVYLGTDPGIKWSSFDSLVQWYFQYMLSLKSNWFIMLTKVRWDVEKKINLVMLVLLIFGYCLQDMEIKYTVQKSLVCGLKWTKKVSKSFSNSALVILMYLYSQQSEGELIIL